MVLLEVGYQTMNHSLESAVWLLDIWQCLCHSTGSVMREVMCTCALPLLFSQSQWSHESCTSAWKREVKFITVPCLQIMKFFYSVYACKHIVLFVKMNCIMYTWMAIENCLSAYNNILCHRICQYDVYCSSFTLMICS